MPDHENRIYLYDTTLRDGAQTAGVDFTVADKISIAHELDALGVDYIEGGWPGANPTDDAFFRDIARLKHAKLTVFGMTRRPGRSVSNDPGVAALTDVGPAAVCLVGKTWDYHVDVALRADLDENICMISESIVHVARSVPEVLFDAEHFFDGYKANPDYAIRTIEAACSAGARWVVLCDTNGGTLPHEIEEIVTAVARHVPGQNLGIHCHNDTENAVANSLAAVRAGVRHVQGTLNGIGERCGNANLTAIIPNLMLKMGYETGIARETLTHLTRISHMLDERLNRSPSRHAAYVGEAAFTHKGGLHVSAVEKNPATYEHIEPGLVGNRRQIVVSDQSGRASILARFREIGIEIEPDHPRLPQLLDLIKQREFEGYSYDGAEASFELLARRALGDAIDYYRLNSFRVIDERRWNARGELVTISEATVKVEVGGENHMAVAEGNGPVNALDNALGKVLLQSYPELADMTLVDYKVRILASTTGTGAVTRVMIESVDRTDRRWTCVGLSTNIIDASYNAFQDAICYKLYRHGVVPV